MPYCLSCTVEGGRNNTTDNDNELFSNITETLLGVNEKRGSPPYLTSDVCGDENGCGVRPREALVDAPPTAHHQRHVEAQHEGHGDQVTEASTVKHKALKCPAIHV